MIAKWVTFLRFILVGALNTTFGYSVYAILIFNNVNYLLSLGISTILGVTFNLVTFSNLVFQSKVNLRILFKFVSVYVGLYIFNSLGLILLISNELADSYRSQLFLIPLMVIFSWFLMKFWVYAK